MSNDIDWKIRSDPIGGMQVLAHRAGQVCSIFLDPDMSDDFFILNLMDVMDEIERRLTPTARPY